MLDLNANRFFDRLDYKFPDSVNPPIIITDNLKTPENLGHIIRLAGNFGCEKVLAVNEKEELRKSKIRKMAEVAGNVIEWQFCSQEEAFSQIPDDYKIVVLETAPNSENIYNAFIPKNIALVVGNEVSGTSPFWIEKADYLYHIPMVGKIKSLNVSHACSMFLYEWLRRVISF